MPYKDPHDPRLLAARRKHYYKNKQPYLDRAKAAKAELARYIDELKESTPCMDCGVQYPFYVMQFDHREGEEKLNNIAKMRADGLSLKRVQDEIAKCDLVCANCHFARTYLRGVAHRKSGKLQPCA